MRLWPFSWARVRQAAFNRWRYWRQRRVAASAASVVRRTPPIPVASEADAEIHMLLCHRHVSMALQGLKSFFRFTPATIALVVHDDGTLDAGDRSLLEHHLPGLRWIDVPESAATMDVELARLGLERCREFRRTYVLARRVFDFPFYSAGRGMLQLDADVIFLQRPTELLDRLASTDPRAPMRFNLDVDDMYCWTDEEIRTVVGFAPTPRVNGGLIAMRYTAAMLPEMWDLVERCLSLPVPANTEWWRDQTLLGMIGGWHGAVALPLEYNVGARLLRQGREDLIAHHSLFWERLYFHQVFLRRVAPALFSR
ncbi:MAG TPA: hypothetical protein VFA43_25670 [Gemmatimonadaceae bacterium]|nr:hypothetical protein [Gemmatimonadaceae bacterium]